MPTTYNERGMKIVARRRDDLRGPSKQQRSILVQKTLLAIRLKREKERMIRANRRAIQFPPDAIADGAKLQVLDTSLAWKDRFATVISRYIYHVPCSFFELAYPDLDVRSGCVLFDGCQKK